MVGGRGLILPASADGHDLVLALRCSRPVASNVRARLLALLERADLQATGNLHNVVTAELDEQQGRVFARREQRYLDLPLQSARGGELPPGAAASRWCRCWPGSVALARRTEGPAPPAGPRRLAARAPAGSGPAGRRRRGGRGGLRAAARGAHRPSRPARRRRRRRAHRRLEPRAAPGPGAVRPDRIELPSGRAAVLDYAAPAGPTISARLQEFFGLPAVGALAGGRVPVVLELLAPNHRPVQVTTDLPSFWRNIYPEVRRELSRRYPRHSWPEDPLAARPEARPARRREP
ncbi:MAG: hypothetical protein H6838_19220 [Planctomycetes bacterium]|nr:hypothetical protein [Planctomycetota bacterium]